MDAGPPPVAEVVITARLPEAAGDATFSLVRVRPEDLARSIRLDEALRDTPGVSLFRRTTSSAANPTIQGVSLRAIAPSGAGRALVTLDGVPQNDPFGGWVIWSGLPPEVLAGVTIVRGAGAGPYGAGALTGVVALEERGAVDGLAAAELAAGELGGKRVAVAGGAGLFFASGSIESGEGYAPIRGAGRGPVDGKTSLESWSASARLQGEILGGIAALRFGAYDEERGGGVPGLSSGAEGRAASLTFVRLPAPESFGFRLQAWLRDSDLQNRTVAVAPGRASATPANNQYATPATGWGINAALRHEFEAGEWEVGADARFAQGQSREYFRNLGAGFTRERRAGGSASVIGAYAEASRRLGSWLVAGGARLDSWSASGALRRETDLATGAVTLEINPSDRSGIVPTARLGARRELDENLWLRGAAYAGFRAPTLNELHRPFRVGNDITEANPQLKPERLLGAEIGFAGGGRWQWDVTVFYNRLADPVTNVTIGAGPGTFPVAGFVPAGGVLRRRQNAGAIDAAGVEAELSGRPAERISVHLGLLANWARVDGARSAPQLTGNEPAQTPRFAASARVDWQAARDFTLGAGARFESARHEDDLNTRELSPSFAADARAAWRVAPYTEFYLAADNLFDARVEIGESADGLESFGAPRSVRAGLSYRR